jgi:hypothetical protein
VGGVASTEKKVGGVWYMAPEKKRVRLGWPAPNKNVWEGLEGSRGGGRPAEAVARVGRGAETARSAGGGRKVVTANNNDGREECWCGASGDDKAGKNRATTKRGRKASEERRGPAEEEDEFMGYSPPRRSACRAYSCPAST